MFLFFAWYTATNKYNKQNVPLKIYKRLKFLNVGIRGSYKQLENEK